MQKTHRQNKLIHKYPNKFSENKVFELAANCKTRTEFSRKHQGAYKYARTYDLFNHKKMSHLPKPHYWNPIQVFKIAKKYKKLSTFRYENKSAYTYARAHKLLSHKNMIHLKRKRPNFTKKEIFLEAKKYNRRIDFIKNSITFYGAARRLKILNKVCSHMKEKKWNNKTVTKEALKYKYRGEFKKKALGAYSYAFDKKILDKVCSHMKYKTKSGLRKKTNYWNPTTAHKEALKYKNRQEFIKNSGGAYVYCLKHNLLNKVCSHMKLLIKRKNKGKMIIYRKDRFWKNYSKKEIIDIIKKYKTFASFSKKEKRLYNYLQKSKQTHLAHKFLKYKKNQPIKWTKKLIIKIAKKYRTIKKFKTKHPTAYVRAWQLGVLKKELKNHFTNGNIIYDKKKIIKLSKQYVYLSDFINKHPTAYKKAKKWGIHKKITNHMKKTVLTIELDVLHPKINKIIQKNGLKYTNQLSKLKFRNRADFLIWGKNNLIILIEAKTCGNKRMYSCKELDNQIKGQTLETKKKYPNHKIIHLLVSEVGTIISQLSHHCISLKNLNLFLQKIKKNNYQDFKINQMSRKELIKIHKKERDKIIKQYLQKN